ncbi:hypothetical protein D3C84_969000 [compost metagenome]
MIGGHGFTQTILRDFVIARALAHDCHQAGIGHDIHSRIAQFQRTTVAVDVHFLQLFGADVHHAHARRVKGKMLFGKQFVARSQHGRDFGFHRCVGAGDDLADAKIFHGFFL